jgi:hypothetical protein
MNKAVEGLVSQVLACQKACQICFDACLKEDHVAMMAECIRTDRECADICGLVVDFSYRESNLFPDLVAVCARACEVCATECEQHDHDHCQQCAKACRECEAACKAFLAA